MNKITKRIISGTIAGLMSVSCLVIGGCGVKPKKEVEVVGASAMYKYEQRYVFKEEEKATEIKMDAAANEYEPAQIIICANDEQVSSYDLTTADFVSSSGKKIAKSNVEVYSAYYNSINVSHNGYPAGYVPDILIPLDKRIKYGDNTVATGENQSIWFTVYVPKGTESGEYKADFTVHVNEKTYTVPVTLNVYGFELPDETHVKSAFAIWGPTYGNNMLTPYYGDRAKAAEQTYYEFLLKYRVAGTSLPNLNTTSPEIWVEQAVEYAARPEVPSFSIPFPNGEHETHSKWFNEQYVHDVLSLLVDRSTEELNVFDKLYGYGVIDEPDYTKRYANCKAFVAKMKEIVQTVLDEKDAQGAFEGKPSVREGLRTFSTLITLGLWGEAIGGDIGEEYITGYCPKFKLFETEELRQEFRALQEDDVAIWTYGCNVPGYPYPTYTVDADLVSPRSVGVMQDMYNIEGSLYWCTNLGRVFNGSAYTDAWDPYKTAYCFATWPGDGYLVVPAQRYEPRSLQPYPTMRLEMIREGQEDYEYLYLLKALVAEKGDEAMTALTSKLEKEYATVMVDAKPTEDPEKMIAFKKTIANMILENL